MTKRTTLAAGGLATDPNPFITAAQGAMRRADDVLFKHPDVASLRPGFGVSLAKAFAVRQPRAMHVFGGQLVISSVDGSTWYLEDSGGLLDSDAEPPDTALSPMQFVEARKNLYLTTYTGVRKMTASDATPVAAGLLETPALGISLVDPGATYPRPIEGGYRCAYRACVARKDANDVEVRSAPSPWALADNTSAGPKNAIVEVPLTSDVVAGDVVEVYRSLAVASGSTPSDVLYLASKHTVDSTDISNGYALVYDYTLEELLGAELYTNSTREGALAANYMPPIAVALGELGGCVWYGNTSERQTLGFRILRIDDGKTPAQGLSFARTTGTGSVGTNTITVGSAAGLHTGMCVYDDAGDPESSGANIAAGTTITNISGTTVTLSANLLGSPAAATLNFSDRLRVDSVSFFTTGTGGPSMTVGGKFFFLSGVTTELVGQTARNLALIIQLRTSGPTVSAYGYEDPFTAGTVVLRRRSRTAAAFSITTTAPEGAIVGLDADGSFTSSGETKPNRLYYSKIDQPEHVPVLNYLAIGSESAAILALKRSRNALLVFKEDGVFKVTGSAPDRWRVDELDTATRLYRGSCVSTMNGLVYAWTTQGAVAVSELGVRSLSARAISRELDVYADYMADEPATEGCWVAAWPAAHCVLFGVPTGSGSESTAYVYCYSESTGRWSRWGIASYCAAADRESAAFFWAKTGVFSIRRNTYGSSATGVTGYDASFSLSGWTYDGATAITVSTAERGDWTPAAGDWLSAVISGSTEYRRITAASDNGSGYDLTISSAFSSSTLSGRTAYEACAPVLEWQPFTPGDPFSVSLFREIQIAMDFRDDTSTSSADTRFEIGALCERSTSTDPEDAKAVTNTRAVPARRRCTLRAGLDREVARASECAPWLAGSNVLLPWHCRGVTIVYEPASEDRGTR